MLSKAEIKRLNRYKQSKFRNQDEIFVVEGEKMLEELLQSDYEIQSIYAHKQWIEKNKEIISQKKITNLLFEASQEDLERITLLSTPNQVYSLVKIPQEEISKQQKGLTIVLDGIKDPGNLGTIIRLADWYAIENIICSEDCVDVYNPKTVQSTMGSIFRVKVKYLNLQEYLKSLPSNHAIYGSIVEGGENIYKKHFQEDSILIIGSESHGISPEIQQYVNHKITIPRFRTDNKPESLNASIATAIMISEIKRIKK
ncbi:MAG: RNA methyltransferase [Bacteroidales bacterium]|nr:RNA methyltransferase [Bacteroidales bacterium]